MTSPRLVHRPSTALAHRSLGLGVALGAGLLTVFVLGIAPVAVAIGLLALLVVD